MRTVAAPADSRRSPSQQPADARRPLFENLRRISHARVLATDALLAAILLTASTGWLVWTRSADWQKALVQLAVIAPLVWRRSHPAVVFCVASAIAFAQWALGYRLIGDASLLIALYTVAVHESRSRAVLASLVMEIGAVMAATRWRPAGTVPRSFLFLTATVGAALFAGLTVRSGSEYMGWLAERAERLEIERAGAERARIAREMHDIVAHSLSVVVTLADAACIVGWREPERANEAMAQVSVVGRQALSDMRTLIGVLRTETGEAELTPAPTVDQLDDLFDRVRATGLEVVAERFGQPFPLSAAVELTLYRIAQEALTNTLKHAGATKVGIVLRYDSPTVELKVTDDGPGGAAPHTRERPEPRGHGIEGMRERANLHKGTLRAGPGEGGGWVVSVTVCDSTLASL